MKYKITCEVCGKVVLTSYRQSKTCSEKCKKIRRVNEVRKWQKDNNETWNKYQREYRELKNRTQIGATI